MLADGSYQYVGYAENIHYEDENGKLQVINNAITTCTKKDGTKYSNTANSWQVFFSENLNSPNAVLLTKNDFQLSFNLPNAADTCNVAQTTSLKETRNNYLKELSMDNRAVIYENVLPNIDIAYTINSDLLKEEILLKSKPNNNNFVFYINTKNLFVEEKNNSFVFIDDKGNEVFGFAPMYMEDANGKYSNAVNYTINTLESGYKITITPDYEFLNASDTIYPVIIDPSIMVIGESSTFDTCVDQQYPNSNYYLSENLWTGGAYNTNAKRTYIKFTLPTNIHANTVTSAYLRIKKREYANPTIKAYRVIDSWTSNSVTWNNKPSFNTTDVTGTCFLDTGTWYKIDTTNMVKSWRSIVK